MAGQATSQDIPMSNCDARALNNLLIHIQVMAKVITPRFESKLDT